jgi:hypothetical protein
VVAGNPRNIPEKYGGGGRLCIVLFPKVDIYQKPMCIKSRYIRLLEDTGWVLMYLCRTRYKCGNRTQPPPLLRSIWRLRQTTNERWPSREIRSVSGPFSMMPSFPLFMAARLSSTGDAELMLVFVEKKTFRCLRPSLRGSCLLDGWIVEEVRG